MFFFECGTYNGLIERSVILPVIVTLFVIVGVILLSMILSVVLFVFVIMIYVCGSLCDSFCDSFFSFSSGFNTCNRYIFLPKVMSLFLLVSNCESVTYN